MLEAAPRSWPPVKPMCLQWDFPAWTPTPPDLYDPAELMKERPGSSKKNKENKQPEMQWTPESFANIFCSGGLQRKTEIINAAKGCGVGVNEGERLLGAAVSKGFVVIRGSGPKTKYILRTEVET